MLSKCYLCSKLVTVESSQKFFILVKNRTKSSNFFKLGFFFFTVLELVNFDAEIKFQVSEDRLL